MACLAFGQTCTSSKMMTEFLTMRFTLYIACSCRKKKSMSIKSSNRDTTLFDTLLKSISIYETYSFLANCSTNVDFPTRRAPSTRIEVLPFLVSFYFWSLSYNFRLNILFIFSSVIDITCNMLILCRLTFAKIHKY